MPYDLILSSEKSADDPHLPSDNTTVSPTEPSFLAKMRASAIDKKISEGDSRETLRDKESFADCQPMHVDVFYRCRRPVR